MHRCSKKKGFKLVAHAHIFVLDTFDIMATVVGLESRWPVNAALVVSLQLDGIVNEIIGGMTVSICLGLVGWVWRRKRRVAEAQRSIPSGDGLIGHNFGDQDLRRVSLVGRKLPFSSTKRPSARFQYASFGTILLHLAKLFAIQRMRWPRWWANCSKTRSGTT